MLPTVLAMVCLSNGVRVGVTGMDGKWHSPVAESKGAPVALIFISHDCPICNSYAPEFVRIARSYLGRAYVELIYSEPDITKEMARKHSKEFTLETLPQFLDNNRTFAASCGATVTPQAVVFGRSGERLWMGRIDDRYVRIGSQRTSATTHDLRAALDAILAHRTPKPAGGPPVGCYILRPGIS